MNGRTPAKAFKDGLPKAPTKKEVKTPETSPVTQAA
jgi:hypothetical protein